MTVLLALIAKAYWLYTISTSVLLLKKTVLAVPMEYAHKKAWHFFAFIGTFEVLDNLNLPNYNE